MINISSVSTGIKGLDKTLNYLQMGDNVVIQVENIEDYKKFVKVIFNTKWMQEELNLLEKLVPEDQRYSDVVRVCDVRGKDLRLYSDIVAQEMICFFNK